MEGDALSDSLQGRWRLIIGASRGLGTQIAADFWEAVAIQDLLPAPSADLAYERYYRDFLAGVCYQAK